MHCNGASQTLSPMFPAHIGYTEANDAVFIGLHNIMFGNRSIASSLLQERTYVDVMHHIAHNNKSAKTATREMTAHKHNHHTPEDAMTLKNLTDVKAPVSVCFQCQQADMTEHGTAHPVIGEAKVSSRCFLLLHTS